MKMESYGALKDVDVGVAGAVANQGFRYVAARSLTEAAEGYVSGSAGSSRGICF